MIKRILQIIILLKFEIPHKLEIYTVIHVYKNSLCQVEEMTSTIFFHLIVFVYDLAGSSMTSNVNRIKQVISFIDV